MSLRALLALSTLATSNVAFSDIYRYQDSNGNTIVSYSLSQEAILAGYEIVNDQGLLVEVIPPATPNQEASSAEEQRAQDIRLLSTYGSLEEFESALERSSTQRAEALSLLESKLKDAYAGQLEIENRAGSEERQAGQPSKETSDMIVSNRQMIETLERQIELFNTESDRLSAEQDAQRQRLRTLLGHD